MTNISEILKYAEDGHIEQWVDSFLRNEGKNIPFADGLQKQKRYWRGPIEFDLAKLTRCCGPEDEMQYKVDIEGWKRKTAGIAEFINGGGELPPLIVNFTNKKFIVSDGNHRLGTYEMLGLVKHWVIFWASSKEDFEDLLNIVATRN